jgi:hypothetical protein
MAVDERHRLALADAAKRAFGDDAGITLMELLPPVGWADVATKQDLRAFESRFLSIDSRFLSIDSRLAMLEQRVGKVEDKLDEMSREIRAQTWKLMTLMVAVVGTVVAALRL